MRNDSTSSFRLRNNAPAVIPDCAGTHRPYPLVVELAHLTTARVGRGRHNRLVCEPARVPDQVVNLRANRTVHSSVLTSGG